MRRLASIPPCAFQEPRAVYFFQSLGLVILAASWCPKCCAQGNFQIVRAAGQHACAKPSQYYFIRTLMGKFSYAFFIAVEMHRYEAAWLPPPSSLQEPRARAFHFIQCSSFAKQVLACYWLLVLGVSRPKKTRIRVNW